MTQDSSAVMSGCRIGVNRRSSSATGASLEAWLVNGGWWLVPLLFFRVIGVHRRSSAAVLILIFAAGCAPLHWHKDGAEAATLERDVSECRNQARMRARAAAPLFGQPPPAPVGMDSRGQVATGRAARYDTDRALLEHDYMRACMLERGYELARVNGL
ncbi:MAG TPA: hypothetical protein VFO57_08925 [Burkholderiales bacterium]|nr:hypothetical protein [Burkholderiales bacterium]